MQTTKIDFSDVVSQCMALIRSNIGLTLITIFLITAGFSLIDLAPGKGATIVPNLVVNLVVQYYFVERLLGENGAGARPGKRRYGALFVASLLSGLGIMAGLLLLVVTGIFLMARWSISTPFIVADGMSGSEALKASWDATSGSRWVLFSIFLLACVALCGLFLAIGLVAAFSGVDPDSLFFSISTNLLVSFWSVGGWILGVGIYRCLKPSSNALADVFA